MQPQLFTLGQYTAVEIVPLKIFSEVSHAFSMFLFRKKNTKYLYLKMHLHKYGVLITTAHIEPGPYLSDLSNCL